MATKLEEELLLQHKGLLEWADDAMAEIKRLKAVIEVQEAKIVKLHCKAFVSSEKKYKNWSFEAFIDEHVEMIEIV